jgi:hypothetical protein
VGEAHLGEFRFVLGPRQCFRVLILFCELTTQLSIVRRVRVGFCRRRGGRGQWVLCVVELVIRHVVSRW